jgi:hypothetical protein
MMTIIPAVMTAPVMTAGTVMTRVMYAIMRMWSRYFASRQYANIIRRKPVVSVAVIIVMA